MDLGNTQYFKVQADTQQTEHCKAVHDKAHCVNRFFKSFLAYVPYTVLAAMTFPAILSATGNFYSALAGMIVGIVVAFLEKGLLVVALSSCVAVLVVELIFRFV